MRSSRTLRAEGLPSKALLAFGVLAAALLYAANATDLRPECASATIIDDADRSMNFQYPGNIEEQFAISSRCDDPDAESSNTNLTFPTWYRFKTQEGLDTFLPMGYFPPIVRCKTHALAYLLSGQQLPTNRETKSMRLCFYWWTSDCLCGERSIQVTHCDHYYVWQSFDPQCCVVAFCYENRTCDPETYWNGTTCASCAPSCGQGFFESQGCNVTHNRVCTACHESCGACSGPLASECLSCASTYVNNSGSCLTSCPTGRYNDSGICQDCHENCTACFGGGTTQCTACTPGLVRYNTSCLTQCPLKTVNVSNECLDCHDTCLSCSAVAADACLTCNRSVSAHQYLHEGSCVASCPNGTYADGGDVCQSCASSCLTCSGGGSSACLTCNRSVSAHQYLHEGTCVASCPNGTYADGGDVCQSCASSCLTCSGGGSSACVTCNRSVSAHQYLHGGSCVASCPNGTYADGGDVCQSCASSCLTCSGGGSSACLACNASLTFFPVSGSAGQCVVECPTNFTRSDSSASCVACTLCQESEFASVACSHQANRQCSACHGTCQSCSSANSSACLTCNSSSVSHGTLAGGYCVAAATTGSSSTPTLMNLATSGGESGTNSSNAAAQVSLNVTIPADAAAAGKVFSLLRLSGDAGSSGVDGVVNPTTTGNTSGTYTAFTFVLGEAGNMVTSSHAFSSPVILQFNVSALCSLHACENLQLYLYNTTSGQWTNAASTCSPSHSAYSASSGILEIHVCHFTQFALFETSSSQTGAPSSSSSSMTLVGVGGGAFALVAVLLATIVYRRRSVRDIDDSAAKGTEGAPPRRQRRLLSLFDSSAPRKSSGTAKRSSLRVQVPKGSSLMAALRSLSPPLSRGSSASREGGSESGSTTPRPSAKGNNTGGALSNAPQSPAVASIRSASSTSDGSPPMVDLQSPVSTTSRDELIPRSLIHQSPASDGADSLVFVTDSPDAQTQARVQEIRRLIRETLHPLAVFHHQVARDMRGYEGKSEHVLRVLRAACVLGGFNADELDTRESILSVLAMPEDDPDTLCARLAQVREDTLNAYQVYVTSEILKSVDINQLLRDHDPARVWFDALVDVVRALAELFEEYPSLGNDSHLAPTGPLSPPRRISRQLQEPPVRSPGGKRRPSSLQKSTPSSPRASTPKRKANAAATSPSRSAGSPRSPRTPTRPFPRGTRPVTSSPLSPKGKKRVSDAPRSPMRQVTPQSPSSAKRSPARSAARSAPSSATSSTRPPEDAI